MIRILENDEVCFSVLGIKLFRLFLIKIDFRNFHQFETVKLDFLKFNCGPQGFVS